MKKREDCARLAPALGLVLLAAGCLAPVDGEEDGPEADEAQLQGQEEALYANTGFFWTGAPPIVPVCWNNSSEASITRRNWVRDVVTSNWARHARVNLTGWGDCPATGFSGLRIQIDNRVDPPRTNGFFDNGSNNNGASRFRSGRFLANQTNALTLNLGFGGACSNNSAYCESNTDCTSPAVCTGIPACGTAVNRKKCVEALSLHEFGHALGFWHEEERNDYTVGADRNGNGTPDSSESLCAVQNEDWDGNGIRNNYSPLRYGAYDISSVMSYCGQTTIADWKQTLSNGDIASVQRAYGRRIAGSLVSRAGRCAAAHYPVAEDPAFVWDCDEAADDQEWRFPVSSGTDRHLQLTGASGSMCLAAASAADGSPVRLRTCSTSRDWVFEQVSLQGFGGMCLDVPNGVTTNGTRVQMWQCGAAGGVNQRWSINGGQVRFGTLSGTKCLRNVNNQLVLWDCGAAGQTFTFNANGTLTNGTCMDVQNVSDAQFVSGQGLPTNGSLINFSGCNTSLNQRWNLSGRIRYGANHGLCLARDAETNGGNLTLRTCGSATTQQWEYYFRP